MSEEIVRDASFFFGDDSESESESNEEVAMEKEANVKSTSSSSPLTTSEKEKVTSKKNKVWGSESDDFVMENTYDDEAVVETKTDVSSSGNQNEKSSKSSFVLQDGGDDIVIEERKERRDPPKSQTKNRDKRKERRDPPKPQTKNRDKRKERRDPLKPQKKNRDKKFWKGYVFMETDPDTFKTEEFCVIDQDDTMIKYCLLEPIANCKNTFSVRKEDVFDDKNIRRVRIAKRSEMMVCENLWKKEQGLSSMFTTTTNGSAPSPKVSKKKNTIKPVIPKTKKIEPVFPMKHVLLSASYSSSSTTSPSSKIQEKATTTTTTTTSSTKTSTSPSSKIQEKASATTTTTSTKTSSPPPPTKTTPKETPPTKTTTTKVTPRRYSKHRTKVRLSKLGVKEREKANDSRAIHTKLLEQKDDITPNQIYDMMLKTHFIKGLSRRGELYGNKVLSLGVARNFSQGLMVSAASLMYPELTKVLARFVRQYYPTFQFTSIFINKNFPGHLHTDRHNFGKSLMFACGDYTGGELLIQCPRNQLETQMQEHELKFQYVFSFKFHSISTLKRQQQHTGTTKV